MEVIIIKTNKSIKLILILCTMLTLSGCSKQSIQSEIANVPLSVQLKGKHGLPGLLSIHEAWKYDVDNIYVNAGVDEYTNTYLLEELPFTFSTLIGSANDYEMNTYASLDSDSWLTNDNTTREIVNVLSYNKKYKDKRFTGISINANLINTDDNKLQICYNNLQEVRKIIDIHNEYDEDNLQLLVNVNNEIIQDKEFIENIIKLTDEIIYVDKVNPESLDNKSELFDNIEDLFIIADEYEDKKIHINIDCEELTEVNKGGISKLANTFKKITKYKSFSGVMLENYESYIEYAKQKDLK